MITGGTSMRLKLIALVPMLMLFAAFAGLVISIEPGSDLSASSTKALVTAGTILLLGVPVALLLAYATLQPLEDLLRATERMREGRFGTRVPRLALDEYSILAGSLNQAMDGLAERQRLAERNVELLDEVSASRARLVTAADAERRRVERNLHDGAQQRLVALGLRLRMAEEQAAADPELQAMVAEAATELAGATQELRELARGLDPQVLSTGGLEAALRQLAERATIPVEVQTTSERFPDPVESTIYFVASESLANIAKYAQAGRAIVSAKRQGGRLRLEVRDDGIGGAQAEPGSGLAGLADRVEALGGTLTVTSERGEGTAVVVELPLDG